MTKLFSILCLCVLTISGCSGGTRVIKDGFMARQVTEDDMRFLRSTRSWDSECRWDQLVQEKASGKYFCPPPSTKEDFNTKTYAAHIDAPKSDAVISAAIHGLFFVGGMSTLGALMPATQITQNASQSVQANPYAGSAISTQYINGQVPSWLTGK